MSGPGAGFEYPAAEVSWLKRDVLLFANSIGCTADELHFLYHFYPQCPGQRLIQFLKPLPPTSAGKRFELRSKVIGVYDKGKVGSVVETEQLLVEKKGGNEEDVYARMVGSAVFIGQGNWGGPKGPSTAAFPPPEGKPEGAFELKLSNEAALLYRLNGDYNPLHATPEPGQKMGFGGAIMHGLFSWNATCHGLLKELGGSNPANIKEFQARFASPVKPGDKLLTEMWRTGEKKDGWEEIRFLTRVEGGKVCVSNGRAMMKCVEGGTKSKL
ncbi:hypothetical protein EPUS_06591 [Endocarpon pusillum Z07020]|uniref:MaoC-like domain-containing protein n=1 Tax=Endocarpon pusillum (strain Z07020 / HMAS-L-300199) TaxID=1263415 RepID=U1GQ03_ENDPU|nr:uncharacterized protein EPUS_06591 [Endocarpon pusillum Z07020]ERF74413.1 hypothetical protein EPUS_06591 [Endocarpon pusillum Z07020]